LPEIIELITSHSKISKDTLKYIQEDENLKCIFMALIKKHYSVEEMEKFLKENKEFLENV
jgi:predicted patatin/cPLA2 family phospholipase